MKVSLKQAKSRILISGTNSGLGKYLLESLGGISWNRNISDSEKDKLKKEGVDAIIHCAFNSSNQVTSENLSNYLEDNLLLTQKLLKIPHQKFIFISSVDVYPKDGKIHKEDEVIDVNAIENIYGLTKLMSESLIKKQSKNYLILRCTALLGKYSRKNSLKKIIEDKNPTLTLSTDSSFNYVLHTDLADFIKKAINENINGIINIASSKNVTLSEVVKILKKKVQFGVYKYSVGNIDNSKISLILPIFLKNSQEIVVDFITKGV